MNTVLFSIFIRILPKKLVSYVVGHLTQIRRPKFLVLAVMKWFVAHYKIDMSEAEKPFEEYFCLNDLFTRKLKPGVRPVEGDFVHPADSELTQAGEITKTGGGSFLIQAKGFQYTLEGLLNSRDVDDFDGGHYATYYLCPTDYHRVHSPVTGKIVGYSYNPGFLWPVNEWSVGNIKNLFAINERITVWIERKSSDGTLQKVALTMVGATNVGKMSLSFESGLFSNSIFKRFSARKKYSEGIPIKAGEEIGIFHLGSTVIMAYSRNFPMDNPKLGKVKVGEKIGSSVLS
ncbi:MAG: phosphatidylserine decarboxylase [Bdellovibrionales bacterium]|nr:phosphatidylserine decarboxylase [Bdellovibrionales bacterium]